MSDFVKESKAQAIICVVDDDELFNEVLCENLQGEGYQTISFSSAKEFLLSDTFVKKPYDLIVTDINMPGISGYELCKQVRAQFTRERVPVVMVTGNDSAREKAKGLAAGADDFIQKPFRNDELMAKLSSLLSIRSEAIERMDRLTKFISPNIADMVVDENYPVNLNLHRAQVTVMFSDLRGFTAFSENAEPEEVLDVLNGYYKAVGNCAIKYNATLGHLAGDGIMLFLNDPQPIEDHQEVALKLAMEIRDALNLQKVIWKQKGYRIDFGIGLAEGFATMGGIGFDKFWQYSVIGPVANFASRMCHYANDGQILVSHRFLQRTLGHLVFEVDSIGSITLKGIEKTVKAFNVISLAGEVNLKKVA